MRKAIQRAIDVKSILDAAYGGTAPLAHGIVPLGITGNRPASKYSYNPDEARALLAEAGVSGLTLEFKTLNEAYRVTAAQIVQANLADVGITLNIIPRRFRSILEPRPAIEGRGLEDAATLVDALPHLARSVGHHAMVHQEPGGCVELGTLVRPRI